ncbi:unnamed protein product, partial [Brenthis ino]
MVVWYVSDYEPESEQSSPFRRWTTGSGAGSSYRHHDHRGIYSKQMSEGSVPVQGSNGSCGGVARWSLGLEQLLADPAGAAAFAHFLSKEFAAENIRFWWSCEQYRCCDEDEKRGPLAMDIYQRHLAEGASEPVNVDAAARRAAALRLHQVPPPQDLFTQAQKQIFNVMKFDSYPRFLRSGVHAECARADLRGLPPPYAPHPPGEPETPKLKKSASNASERRRSGSLLPWKGRTASRDRTVSTTSNNEDHNMTDVVKTSQSVSGQCSLCRVVLPDGATSVVPVDAGASVRRLVDRLLQRRNLLCGAYDVVLNDGEQGSGACVDVQAPSSALGGRCVAVERRCVVRVALGARCVAVRCRPARRLRHVLRPVLQRYCAAPAPPHAVLLAGVPVHPDTLVQELDGMRVQVVEVAGAAPEPRDDDADSLSDVALRHDDNDDAQSASSASSGAEAARVRAALRPGAPLHHPPADFLENLRETQRQRLQTRTPPPLPPKPAQRSAPTVV